jgi:cation diffusion facilitator CzcD-associated flavoprotein CzcO
VCVIGAGSSGIAAAKALHERGIPFECFDRSDQVGGNWVFGNPNGMSAAYRGLYINTSRERMEYSDFPMSKRIPDFPHHTHIRDYFNDYVDHFGFRDRITFSAEVTHARRLPVGGWEVEIRHSGAERPEVRHYDALLVANGHHWDPRWPEPPIPGSDTFAGVQIHAHSYRDNDVLAGKDVVILGMGNSAMDIAVESSYVAGHTYLAARRGAWVIPKYLGGKPADRKHPIFSNPRIPFPLRRAFIMSAINSAVGPMENYGLPKPDHKLGQAHPTVSGRILDRISHGAITPKPNLAALEGGRVRFADATTVHADYIIYCTGYRITFPFFEEDFVSAPDNRIELFRRVFMPEVPNLFFIGLLQPLGAIMPLAEAQGQWVCDYLRGQYHLPSATELRKDIDRDQRALRRRYVTSKRHTIQVDFDDYLFRLERERRAGAARARAAAFALPVAPRAAQHERLVAAGMAG